MSERDKRTINQANAKTSLVIKKHFYIKNIKYSTGLTDVSQRAVRRCSGKHKYLYCTKRRRGIITKKDCRKRKNFTKTVADRLRSNIWADSVSFYFDGVNFTRKCNFLEEVHHCKNKA